MRACAKETGLRGRRWLISLLIWPLLACGMGACGASARREAEPKGDDVVRIGSYAIGKAELTHWMAVEAVLSYPHQAGQVVPRGVLPDPPKYVRCVDYLRTKSGANRGSLSAAELKRRCQRAERQLRDHILEILITNHWMSEEAAERGITVTRAEVDRAFSQQFKDAAERQGLVRNGVSEADQRQMATSVVILKRLESSVSPLRFAHGPERGDMAERVDAAYAKLGREIKRKWIPKTSCQRAYVIDICVQAHRPLPPR